MSEEETEWEKVEAEHRKAEDEAYAKYRATEAPRCEHAGCDKPFDGMVDLKRYCNDHMDGALTTYHREHSKCLKYEGVENNGWGPKYVTRSITVSKALAKKECQRLEQLGFEVEIQKWVRLNQ